MKTTITSITEEIAAAHTLALDDFAEAMKEPIAREVCKRLFRVLETWELELLTSQIGKGIDVDTFSRVSGALAAFQVHKDLLQRAVMEQAAAPEAVENRASRFTQSLLGNKSRPV